MNDLKHRCKTNTQDGFVGIKADSDDAIVYFPIGFQLAEEDTEIRRDILHLFNILKEFKDKNEGIINIDNKESSNKVQFPLNAYLEIINYYMENGYYVEIDSIYHTRAKGKINWSRTIKNQNPILQEYDDGTFSPIYTNFTVKDSTPNENNEIININKYCVYESFKKLGWLFTSFVPQKPKITLDTKRFLIILHNKLSNTFRDSEKKLFKAMIDMLKYLDNQDNKNNFYFGTKNFEHVWEKLIDNTFGIKNKEEYFPRSKWVLANNNIKNDIKYALEPDTIMEYEDKIYVIDAKYYKYGETNNSQDLPKTSDINKQITYAEYIQKNKNYDDENIYNAFLIPYNKYDNLFDSDDIYVNIGEAVGDWRTNDFKYEHIQGILVDIKYLMYNYKGIQDSKIIQLANFIEKTYEKNKELFNR